jgi:hypothetical protein
LQNETAIFRRRKIAFKKFRYPSDEQEKSFPVVSGYIVPSLVKWMECQFVFSHRSGSI